MSNNKEESDEIAGRVTRSLRKRLSSVDREDSPLVSTPKKAIPSSQKVAVLDAISEKENDKEKLMDTPVKTTASRSKTTEPMDTPNRIRTRRSSQLNEENVQQTYSPARRLTRRSSGNDNSILSQGLVSRNRSLRVVLTPTNEHTGKESNENLNKIHEEKEPEIHSESNVKLDKIVKSTEVAVVTIGPVNGNKTKDTPIRKSLSLTKSNQIKNDAQKIVDDKQPYNENAENGKNSFESLNITLSSDEDEDVNDVNHAKDKASNLEKFKEKLNQTVENENKKMDDDIPQTVDLSISADKHSIKDPSNDSKVSLPKENIVVSQSEQLSVDQDMKVDSKNLLTIENDKSNESVDNVDQSDSNSLKEKSIILAEELDEKHTDKEPENLNTEKMPSIEKNNESIIDTNESVDNLNKSDCSNDVSLEEKSIKESNEKSQNENLNDINNSKETEKMQSELLHSSFESETKEETHNLSVAIENADEGNTSIKSDLQPNDSMEVQDSEVNDAVDTVASSNYTDNDVSHETIRTQDTEDEDITTENSEITDSLILNDSSENEDTVYDNVLLENSCKRKLSESFSGKSSKPTIKDVLSKSLNVPIHSMANDDQKNEFTSDDQKNESTSDAETELSKNTSEVEHQESDESDMKLKKIPDGISNNKIDPITESTTSLNSELEIPEDEKVVMDNNENAVTATKEKSTAQFLSKSFIDVTATNEPQKKLNQSDICAYKSLKISKQDDSNGSQEDDENESEDDNESENIEEPEKMKVLESEGESDNKVEPEDEEQSENDEKNPEKDSKDKEESENNEGSSEEEKELEGEKETEDDKINEEDYSAESVEASKPKPTVEEIMAKCDSFLTLTNEAKRQQKLANKLVKEDKVERLKRKKELKLIARAKREANLAAIEQQEADKRRRKMEKKLKALDVTEDEKKVAIERALKFSQQIRQNSGSVQNAPFIVIENTENVQQTDKIKSNNKTKDSKDLKTTINEPLVERKRKAKEDSSSDGAKNVTTDEIKPKRPKKLLKIVESVSITKPQQPKQQHSTSKQQLSTSKKQQTNTSSDDTSFVLPAKPQKLRIQSTPITKPTNDKTKKRNKRKLEIAEPKTLLNKPQWTKSGEFVVSELTKIPKISSNKKIISTATDFVVIPLDSNEKSKLKSIGKAPQQSHNSALNFKVTALNRADIKRESSKQIVQQKVKQKANQFTYY